MFHILKNLHFLCCSISTGLKLRRFSTFSGLFQSENLPQIFCKTADRDTNLTLVFVVALWDRSTKFFHLIKLYELNKMEADDQDKTMMEPENPSGSKSGRMSITEEIQEDSDGLTNSDDESDDLSDDDDEDYDIYYGGDNEDLDDGPGVSGSQFNNNDDPEYFGYECLSVAQVKDLLSESIAAVQASIQVSFRVFKLSFNLLKRL